MALRAPLSQTSVQGFDDGMLTLGVSDRTAAEILKANSATLQAALDGVVGRPLRMRIVVESARTAPAAGPAEFTGGESEDLVRYATERLP
jgi:hypothetical protein